MKLKNFKPREMREVEYFGETIRIPSCHEWVATCKDGSIRSFIYEPYYDRQDWLMEDTELFGFYVGCCTDISESDAANSLRHYPIGAK